MKTAVHLLILAVALCMVTVASLRAQLVADGATNTLANVTNIIPGSVTVGTNGSFTLLVLSDNTLVTNSAHVVIGANATAKSNEVRLISPTARLQIGGSTGFRLLLVGSNGASSRLVVSNGAQVVANGGSYIGFGAPTSNNVAVVTGAGSVWSEAGQVSVGQSGVGNQLIVTVGGQVLSGDGRIGSVGSNNLAVVTGMGSHWSNQTDFFVGVGGAGNRLLVENGGRVSDGSGQIGANVSARSNEVVVTGAGSLWSNRLDLIVGGNGDFSRLAVSNGGWVVNGNGTMGLSGGSSGNSNLVVVTGASSVWSNRADLAVGLTSSGNRLLVSEGGTVFAGRNGLIGVNSSAGSNSVTVTDPGTRCLISSNLLLGSNGAFNLLVVSNGALVVNSNGYLGFNVSSSNNLTLLAGAGTMWSNRESLFVGQSGAGNRMTLSQGARLECRFATLGASTSSSNNEVVVTGAGSFWRIQQGLDVGSFGSGNRLVISNGAWLRSSSGEIGALTSSNNEVLVTGAGSAWTNGSTLFVGAVGSGNRLVIRDGAQVFEQPFGIIVGAGSSSFNNRLVVDGGTLRAPNSGSGILEVRRGTNVLNAGLIDVELIVTNAAGVFEFNGGTLSARSSKVANGQLFRVGNGVSPATFLLASNGAHSFGNGLTVSANATVTGNGAVTGVLTVQNGGTLSPGTSVGKMVLSNSPVLQGATIMEISKDGVALTNDQVQVIGALNYGGSLTVSHLGPSALTVGDSFRLFEASSYAGSFGSLSLPALSPDLAWSNKLLVDGSLEVVFESVITSNVTVRVMAANITSGNDQRYESPGLNILKGLKPDIVAIQEFNYASTNGAGLNTPGAFREMIDATLGTNYVFFRESGYAIPNGIISRYPILASGSWIDSDTGVNDRGFAFAQIDLPGTNDLYVVSVHLKASSGASNEARRAAEAAEIKALISSNFPANAWIIVAGDMNLFSETEQAILTLETFLSDDQVPADQNGDPDTNAGRAERYDRVLPSFSMTNTLVPLVMPSRTYTNGLVFDSRVYTPLSEVAPVQLNDSGASNMQHMAVVKVFNVPFDITNSSPSPGDRFWTNALGGNYEVASNWLAHAVPPAQGNAHFTTNASYQVAWSADALAANASFNATSGSVTQAIGAASWTLTNSYIVGRDSVATAAVTHITGTLRVTNSAGTAQFKAGELGHGSFNLRGGEVVTDFLRVTNGSKSAFNFSGGTLRTRAALVQNGSEFVIGTGASPATFELLGNSTHVFVNGLRIQPKGLLTGNGTVSANLAANISGIISPGLSIGRLIFTSGALNFLAGSTNFFEINKEAGTNDTIVSLNLINYAGTLVVTNLGGTLALGDRFQLFISPFYFGGFTTLSMPALAPGLSWKNNTRLDGSVEIVTTPARDFGVDVSHFQGASGVSQASWNQMFAQGKRFVFIKATEGLTGPHDDAMSNNVARATAAGLLAGVYHFAHPENRPTTNGAVLEASNMVVYAGSAIGPGRLRPVIDIEGSATTLSTEALTDWVIAFSNEIIARRGTGAAPIIYCSQNSANVEFDNRLADYDLWLRTVTSGSDPAVDDPPAQSFFTNSTGVFNNWSFWQYSDTGSSGGISPLDLDVCHSEYKPLTSFIIPGAPPTTIELAGMTLTMTGEFGITFANTPGAIFTVLATPDPSLPLSNWTVLGPVTEISPGQFQFIDPDATIHPQRFYVVRSP